MKAPLTATHIADLVGHASVLWPGAHELYAITDDGAALCRQCCVDEGERISDAKPGDGWLVRAYGRTDTADEGIFCGNCYRQITPEVDDVDTEH